MAAKKEEQPPEAAIGLSSLTKILQSNIAQLEQLQSMQREYEAKLTQVEVDIGRTSGAVEIVQSMITKIEETVQAEADSE